MQKTVKQLEAEIKQLNTELAKEKKQCDNYNIDITMLKGEVKKLSSLLGAERCISDHGEEHLKIAESELHRRDALKPKDAIFEVLHKLELPEQVSVINQVVATVTVVTRKNMEEADNTAKYLRNNYNTLSNNLTNIANGTTTLP